MLSLFKRKQTSKIKLEDDGSDVECDEQRPSFLRSASSLRNRLAKYRLESSHAVVAPTKQQPQKQLNSKLLATGKPSRRRSNEYQQAQVQALKVEQTTKQREEILARRKKEQELRSSERAERVAEWDAQQARTSEKRRLETLQRREEEKKETQLKLEKLQQRMSKFRSSQKQERSQRRLQKLQQKLDSFNALNPPDDACAVVADDDDDSSSSCSCSSGSCTWRSSIGSSKSHSRRSNQSSTGRSSISRGCSIISSGVSIIGSGGGSNRNIRSASLYRGDPKDTSDLSNSSSTKAEFRLSVTNNSTRKITSSPLKKEDSSFGILSKGSPLKTSTRHARTSRGCGSLRKEDSLKKQMDQFHLRF